MADLKGALFPFLFFYRTPIVRFLRFPTLPLPRLSIHSFIFLNEMSPLLRRISTVALGALYFAAIAALAVGLFVSQPAIVPKTVQDSFSEER